MTRILKCDRCGSGFDTGTRIDVWDENGSWLAFCGWPCVHAIAVLRRTTNGRLPWEQATVTVFPPRREA